ncbi:restriction endonuclease subunit S [Pseudoalteromonas marina]|uniref:restriction endonuclease subunit S n=1 Tax=Pseudoalteromonas marina TaxID=267375 RepID=UPI0023F0163E|nr:restriction endonuclease subunit S [Pseudoalteromonas marina]
MVPNGWELRELKELTTIYDGTHATPKYVESGVPFYSVEHLTKGDFSKTKFITEEVFDKENKRVKLERHDILMTRIGDIGTAVHLDWDVRASFYVSLALLKATSNFDSSFMTQYINSSEFHRELWKRIIHVAFPKKINLGEIGKCHVCLPPLPEQRKIATILGTWDKAISTTERLIDNSKQQKKALMQQLLTGKKRLLDDSGKPFEGEWGEVNIGSTSKCFSGGTPSRNKEEYYGGNIPWITSGKLNDRYVGTVNEYISELGLKNSSAKVVKNGSLLIAMYGATAGKVAINKLNGATVNQAVLALEPMEHCHNLFLFYLFEVEMVKALKLVQGGQPNLSATIIKNIKIKLPPLDEQQKIASVLVNADKEIELLEQQLADLKREKKALMQQLLTGKRRVKVDERKSHNVKR